MGSIPLEHLWPQPLQVGVHAHEIGSRPKKGAVTATLIGRLHGGDGPLTYLGEILVDAAVRKRAVQYEQVVLEGGHQIRTSGLSHQWLRQEVTISAQNGFISAGHHIQGAEWPYTNGIVERAHFRKPSKKERPTLTLDLTQPEKSQTSNEFAFKTLQAMEIWVESQSYDPWEKGDNLVAGPFKNVLTVPFPNKIKNPGTPDLILGVCENFDGYFRELWSSDETIALLRDVIDGKIDCRYAQARTGRSITLYETTLAEVGTLLKYAIAQALCGVHQDEIHKSTGTPVFNEARNIFLGHINNQNRHITSESTELPIDAEVLDSHRQPLK